MKKIKAVFLTVFVGMLFSCSNSESQECKPGERRCTGNNLEVCSFFKYWDLLKDCSIDGGRCVTSANDAYCDGSGETPDEFYEWPDETETPEKDKTPDNNNDPFSDFDFPDEGPDENYYPDEETDEFHDEYPDEDFDEEPDDSPEPECGNGIVEEGEVCEKGEVGECIEIDPELYSGGLAICLDDCNGYNTITCYKKDQ